MIFDAHTHIFSPRIVSHREEYIHRDPCFALLYSSPKAKIVTVQELLVSMERFEVDVSLIANIGWTSQELCLESNDYILECLARYPQKLVGLCAIQPKAGDAALRELERCVKQGIMGVGEMRPDMQGFDMESGGATSDIAAYLEIKNLVWMSHASEPVGHIYAGKGKVTPETIYPFILRYPNLKIILAHWGGGLPFYALMPEVKHAIGNVFFDTAASPFLYNRAIYKQVVDSVGDEHILFGSDYPLMTPARIMKEIDSSDLPVNSKKRIIGDNSRRIFDLKELYKT